MRKKKRHWFLNLLIVFTLLLSITAFAAHYKNWTKVKEDHIKILSGIYYKKLNFVDINAVSMVEKIPALERISGFSVKQWEKGKFKDSITESTVYIYVDDLKNEKIRLTYQDSLQLFFNYSDSTKTREMYRFFMEKIKGSNEQKN